MAYVSPCLPCPGRNCRACPDSVHSLVMSIEAYGAITNTLQKIEEAKKNMKPFTPTVGDKQPAYVYHDKNVNPNELSARVLDINFHAVDHLRSNVLAVVLAVRKPNGEEIIVKVRQDGTRLTDPTKQIVWNKPVVRTSRSPAHVAFTDPETGKFLAFRTTIDVRYTDNVPEAVRLPDDAVFDVEGL